MSILRAVTCGRANGAGVAAFAAGGRESVLGSAPCARPAVYGQRLSVDQLRQLAWRLGAAARHLLAHGWPEDKRGVLFAYNEGGEYADAVLAFADGYREIEARLQHEGRLSAGLALAGVSCPLAAPEGVHRVADRPNSTQATVAMANAVIACFGRPHAVCCEDPRDGTGEHPRGRACDFIATSGGGAAGDERVWGDRLAEWVMNNAESLNVLCCPTL